MTGLKDGLKSTDLLLYPNPVNDVLQVFGTVHRLRLLDMTGRVLLVQSEPLTNGLSITHLPSGLYFVELEVANGLQTQKLIKQ